MIFPQSFNFTVQVPDGFLQVLDIGLAVFEAVAPDVFHSVAAIKSHVFGYLDALNAGWVAGVVAGMIDGVVFVLGVLFLMLSFFDPD